jgi:predicted nucleotidyltransferase
VKEQKEEMIHFAIKTIQKYISDYWEMGIFGSVARGVYSASSDVDVYLITEVSVDKHIKAELAADLEEYDVDIVFLTKKDVAINQDHLLVKNILKDRRIIDRVER